MTLETMPYKGKLEEEINQPVLLKSTSAASPSLRVATLSSTTSVKGAVGAVSPVRECAPTIDILTNK